MQTSRLCPTSSSVLLGFCSKVRAVCRIFNFTVSSLLFSTWCSAYQQASRAQVPYRSQVE